MTALLGPDLGDGRRRGSPTNQNSLQPLMGFLHSHSNKNWKAGHLLNAELGGSGTSDANLTPLTAAANHAHAVFENHIMRMLELCDRLDQRNPDFDAWYGVSYTVTVSPLQYAYHPATNDIHSYAYSHISLDYRFVKLPKFPLHGPAPHTIPPPPNTSIPVTLAGLGVDPKLADLQVVRRPNFAPSVNIVNWAVGAGGIQFSVEIHNEP